MPFLPQNANKKQLSTPQERLDDITEKVAIALAFLGTFFFFIKLVFL